jgi:phosphate starvation-inducible PhoH-like protein
MKMLLTRIGEGSKLIITGDLEQHDRGYTDNGLKLFMERLSRNKSDMIGSVEFDFSEIERHPVVSEVLNLYET